MKYSSSDKNENAADLKEIKKNLSVLAAKINNALYDGEHQEAGLICPKCRTRRWRVYYSRPKAGGIYRVRECMECQYLLRTLEQPTEE